MSSSTEIVAVTSATENLTLSDVMTWLHSPKSEPHFYHKWFWSAMVISLALHGLMMFIPMASEDHHSQPKPEDKKVHVTQLPTGKKPEISQPKSPKKTPVAKRSQSKAPTVRKKLQVSSPKVVIPSIKKTPPKEIPSQEIPKEITPKTEPKATPEETPEPEVTNTQSVPVADSWDDFPTYPSAQAGCFNLPSCMETGKELDQVAQFFEQELATKKYVVTPTTTETGKKVYQVFRNGRTQFLSLLVAQGKGTVYVLSEQPLSLQDLAKAVEVPGEIYNIIGNLGDIADATCDNFADPNLFCEAGVQRPDIAIMKLVEGEAPDTFFDTYLRTNLVNNSYEISDGEAYGGGAIFVVTKDSGSLYVNLVPNQQNTATIVVIWKIQPQ